MRRIGLIALLVLVGCSSANKPVMLASQGEIDDKAPVVSRLEITIAAPPEKIWKLLADVKSWPAWHSTVSEASMEGPVLSGTAFTWKLGGNEIHSKLAIVKPGEELSWTGKAFGATAIHVWKLERLTGGRVLVHVDESMDGLLLRVFYSSKELDGSNQGWLDDLKAAAEK